VVDAAKIAGYFDPSKTRYDHVGFGLVLQVMPGEEEAKGQAPAKDAKKGPAAPSKDQK
jgi:hypothetical protein